ncbi:LacI family DNA-binding transcriptional regulator [Paenibacillus oceani]|uniref:LacI family DNA-binding transcriptional regulator n=1 Tax=Paenibacillus oceani TaxID=2772510 RepID=A0A927C5V9_9BACL|nr:LacI family DNA-binding transcriptional regulator [Paenibacillus oceani]MBD2861399.1 LacI family DNA-binding transcriptional regulator [Paenibacillus oceani]
MATLKDIAHAAGVTTATVSRALNNEPGVKESTRLKIIGLAKEMNYVSSLSAKLKSESHLSSIGIIWSPPAGLFFNHLCNEIQQQASKRGHYTLVSFAPPDEAMRHFNDHHIENIVFWAGSGWTPSLGFLHEKQRFEGTMLVMGGASAENSHRLGIDRKEAIMKAVEHLAELGHKRIAYIGRSSDKFMGYTMGLLEHRLTYDPDYIINSLSDPTAEQQVLRVLGKEAGFRPTAFIVDSHGVLIEFNHLIRKLGLRVPIDLSVVAYESIPEMTKLFEVPLTSIGPGIHQMAEQVISILLDESASVPEGEYVDRMLSCELIVGQSAAPPADA